MFLKNMSLLHKGIMETLKMLVGVARTEFKMKREEKIGKVLPNCDIILM